MPEIVEAAYSWRKLSLEILTCSRLRFRSGERGGLRGPEEWADNCVDEWASVSDLLPLDSRAIGMTFGPSVLVVWMELESSKGFVR